MSILNEELGTPWLAKPEKQLGLQKKGRVREQRHLSGTHILTVDTEGAAWMPSAEAY